MGFCRVSTDDDHRLGVADIVERIGHGAIAINIANASHCRRMANAGLMVDVVCTPIGGKFTEEICLFIRKFSGPKPVGTVRAIISTDGA